MDKLTGPNSTESGASLSAKEMDACVGSIADYFGDYLSAILKGDDVQNLIFSTKPIKMLKALISVPDILLMRKVERFCKGLQSLSEIDRDRYARRIGELTSERARFSSKHNQQNRGRREACFLGKRIYCSHRMRSRRKEL